MNARSDHGGASLEASSGTSSLVLVLLLATGVALLATILVGYVLLRVNDPGAFSWAPSLLDRRLGAVVAAAQLLTCLGGAGALRYALASKVGAARVALTIALLAAAVAIAVRMVELPSISRQAGFQSAPAKTAGKSISQAPQTSSPVSKHVGDAAQGKRVFLGTCAACHAPDGSGVKGQGLSLRESAFLKDKSDEDLLAFVKKGRQPFDPDSKLHLAMPARGGNPALGDAGLLDAIAYTRELQILAAAAAAVPAPAVAAAIATGAGSSSDQPRIIDGELWVPHSVLPASAAGPAETAKATILLQKPGGEGHALSNVRRFFAILLTATGLHTLYLCFGLWLGLTAVLRTRDVASAVAVAAAYCLVLGAIGTVLVPAFYV